MPSLEFKGKSFVYAHHLSVPFRELLVDAKKSLPGKGAKPSLDDNLIIHGDNLHALKALLPVFAGKVDCIFIDPPYNTGNEGWCYNDNLRSPLMREWLKNASPVDREDLERHREARRAGPNRTTRPRHNHSSGNEDEPHGRMGRFSGRPNWGRPTAGRGQRGRNSTVSESSAGLAASQISCKSATICPMVARSW